MTFRHAAGDEQEERPHRGGPPSFGPFAVGVLALQQLGDPTLLDGSGALRLPCVGGRVEQIAEHLPPDGRVACQQPLDHGVLAHQRA